MVMSGFSQLELEKRLSQLKDTAESIQSLSAWCIKYKHQHRRIVNSWLKVIKRAKVQQRLPLFYLANDVIQYSRRKNLDFVSSFQNVLETAMPLVRDEKLRPAITRILKIWDDRGIYESAYIATLTNFVSNAGKADTKENAQILSDFRTSDLIQRLREMEETEKETDKGLKAINDGDFHVSDNAIDELRANVKSRSQSKLFVSELEAGVVAVERYVGALDREIQLRAELIEQLERSEIFYDTQRSDAKVVAVAYKNFSKRVREVRRKLEECLPRLPDVSPVPSPDVNAPSPTNSDEGLQLPEDAAASPIRPSVDPRSEIERLLGNWTRTKSNTNSPQSTETPGSSHENGTPVPPADVAGMSSFVGSSLLAKLTGGADISFAGFPEPTPLTGDERDLFPDDQPPPPHVAGERTQPRRPSPPPQQQQQQQPPPPAQAGSAIAVVTGVKTAAASPPMLETPLQDDYDDEYDGAHTDQDEDAPEPHLSDFVRMIGQQLDRARALPDTSQPPPGVQIPGLEPAPAAPEIPGLGLGVDVSGPPPDMSRPPPPVLPGLTQPPPPGPRPFPTVPPPDPGLWSGPPPHARHPSAERCSWDEERDSGHAAIPAWKERLPPSHPADRSRSWERSTSPSPTSFDTSRDSYVGDIELPAAFKAAADLPMLPFSGAGDTDHRTLVSVPPAAGAPPPVPAPLPVPPPASSLAMPAADTDARLSSGGDTDHRIWDRSVDAFISQVSVDRDYRRRSSGPAPADSDYRDLVSELLFGKDYKSKGSKAADQSEKDEDFRMGKDDYQDKDARKDKSSRRDRENRHSGDDWRDKDSRQERDAWRDKDSRQDEDAWRDNDSRQGRDTWRDKDSRQDEDDWRDNDSRQDKDDRRDKDSRRDKDDRRDKDSRQDKESRRDKDSRQDKDDRRDKDSRQDKDDRRDSDSRQDKDDRKSKESRFEEDIFQEMDIFSDKNIADDKQNRRDSQKEADLDEDMDIEELLELNVEPRRLSHDKSAAPSAVTPADAVVADLKTESISPVSDTSPLLEVLTPPPAPSPEVVQLEDDADTAAEPAATGDANPSLSSWSTSEDSDEDSDHESSSRRRHRSSKKKRRRRDSGGGGSRRHKKDRRHSRRHERRTSGDGERRRRRDDSEDRDRDRHERRRRDKRDSRGHRRRSRDESTDRSRRDRDRSRSRDRERGSRERHRGKERDRSGERDRRRSRDRDRSRHKDKDRSRDRSPQRRGDAEAASGVFDYSTMGAGAHKSSHRDRDRDRDRTSRRW